MSFTRDLTNQLRQSQQQKKPPPQFSTNNSMNTTTSTKSFDQFIVSNLNQQNTSHILNMNNSSVVNSDVYNVPWDIKVKLLQQQQSQIGLCTPQPPVNNSIPHVDCDEDVDESTQDQYCAPWDLKLQEERLKHLSTTNGQQQQQSTSSLSSTASVLRTNPPPIPPTQPPQIPSHILSKRVEAPAVEYSPPWEHKQAMLLNKPSNVKSQLAACSSNSSNSSLSSSSTCSPTASSLPQSQQPARIIIIQPNGTLIQSQPSQLHDLKLLKSYSNSASNLTTTSSIVTSPPQQQQQAFIIAQNSNNNNKPIIDKFCSWGSNHSSNTSSFDRAFNNFAGNMDETKPFIRSTRHGSQRLPSPSNLHSSASFRTQSLSQHQQPQPPPLPSTPAFIVILEKQGWFHGRITRKHAENVLSNQKIGSFLVRQSESGTTNDFSLSLVTCGGIVHMRICLTDDKFILGQCSQPFPSITKMIEHFSKVEVPIKGAQHVRLAYPINK